MPLVRKADVGYSKNVLVDIHLEEGDWDAAIKVAEQYAFSFNLIEKVADAVISHRPDWVIRVSLKQSDDLIEKTQSKLYPVAARWLERAKKAYQQKGQDAEWQTYIDNLRTTYARRPALQRAERLLHWRRCRLDRDRTSRQCCCSDNSIGLLCYFL